MMVNASAADEAALLKLEALQEGKPLNLVLQFEARAPRDELRAALVRAQSAASATPSASSDPRLLRDPALQQLFTALVTRGPLSADEFWALHGEFDAQAERAATGSGQVRGVASTLAAAGEAVAPSSESAGEVRYELTPTRIHQLFVTYAGLQRAYLRLVPAQLTEAQFWTRFFQSQHYRRSTRANANASASASDAADGVFAVAELEAAEAEARRDRLRRVQRANDLTPDEAVSEVQTREQRERERGLHMDSDSKLSAREYKRSARYQQQLELIRKVNRHAALLVESLAADVSASPALSDANAAVKEKDEPHQRRPAVDPAEQRPSKRIKREAEEPEALPEASAPPSLAPVAPTSVAVPRVEWRGPARAAIASTPLDVVALRASASEPSPSSAAVSESLLRRAHELLRHWWSAVRAADTAKLTRLRATLAALAEEIGALGPSRTELRASLLAALERAPRS